MLPFVVNGDQYRDPQLAKVQKKIGDCKISPKKGQVHCIMLFQGSLKKRMWRECK